ncbi:MAG: hypothetical protein ACYDEX_06455, partial [Mobilitalea sp.]
MKKILSIVLKRKIIVLLFIIILTNDISTYRSVDAEAYQYITKKDFVEKVIKEAGLGDTYNDAIQCGVLSKDISNDRNEYITNEYVAQILNNTWTILYRDVENKKISCKDWFQTPYFSIRVPIKELCEKSYEGYYLKFDKRTKDIIKEKSSLILNELKTKYEYNITLSNELKILLTTDITKILSYDELNGTYYVDDNNIFIDFEFCIKDKIYFNNEFDIFKSNIKEAYDAVFTYDNNDYYSLNLTYGIMKDRIKRFQRISDIKEANVENQEALYNMHSKGVMVGYSNGNYILSRSMKPKSYATAKESIIWISRVVGKNKLRTFTSNGMLIRVSNLPFNSQEWLYILEGVPNDFYRMRYEFEAINALFGSSDNLNDVRKEVVYPNSFHGKYYMFSGIEPGCLEDTIKGVEDSLKLRLNISYKTINSEWSTKLLDIAENYMAFMDMTTTKEYFDKDGNLVDTYTNIAS